MGLLIVGLGLIATSWVGRQLPGLAIGVMPLIIFLERMKREKLTEYWALLESLGISEEEAKQLSHWKMTPEGQDDINAPRVFLKRFTREELDAAAPNWEKSGTLRQLLGVPLMLLDREKFVLDKVLASYKENGNLHEVDFQPLNVLRFSAARLNCPHFYEDAHFSEKDIKDFLAEKN